MQAQLHSCKSVTPYVALNQPNNVLARCLGAARRFNHITFRHAFREQNQVADLLARQARLQPLGLTMCGETPIGLRDLVMKDQLGAVFYRRVAMTTGASS
nr:Replication protein A1-like protein [Ipomoea batatas]GMD28203.1 Replication protein A1-like protein [Ipomoea batatas]